MTTYMYVIYKVNCWGIGCVLSKAGRIIWGRGMKKLRVSFCAVVILTMVITSLGFMSFDGINNYLYAEAGDETSISVRASAYEKDENIGRKEPEALKGAKAFWYKLSGCRG